MYLPCVLCLCILFMSGEWMIDNFDRAFSIVLKKHHKFLHMYFKWPFLMSFSATEIIFYCLNDIRVFSICRIGRCLCSSLGYRCMIDVISHFCPFYHFRGQWLLPMTPPQRLYRMGKTGSWHHLSVYENQFTRDVETLFILSRYYPSPYPVTNRIMTVQPTMSPYMSPVSAYQVLHKILNMNLANSNSPLFSLLPLCYI